MKIFNGNIYDATKHYNTYLKSCGVKNMNWRFFSDGKFVISRTIFKITFLLHKSKKIERFSFIFFFFLILFSHCLPTWQMLHYTTYFTQSTFYVGGQTRTEPLKILPRKLVFTYAHHYTPRKMTQSLSLLNWVYSLDKWCDVVDWNYNYIKLNY